MKLVELVAADVNQAIKRFEQFHQHFAPYFATKTRTMAEQAKHYIHGQLLSQQRGNMQQFEKIIPESNQQSMYHFVSNSPWGEEAVIESIQATITERIGDEEDGSLHIDESGFEKQGNGSVGVKRQYCGRLGKVDNCQVGVFLGYSKDSYRILIDKRLYLPQEWTEDQARRKQYGVPEEIEFGTKAELGLEMVRAAQERSVPFGWVGMDSHYGQQPWLLAQLEQDNLPYIADIPCNSRVWLEKPKTEIPPRRGERGRIPTLTKVKEGENPPVEVRQLASQLESKEWTRLFVRDSERKELWTRLACLRVYPVRDQLPGPKTWLILRQDEDTNKLKFQFVVHQSTLP